MCLRVKWPSTSLFMSNRKRRSKCLPFYPTPRNANLYLIVALAITLGVILAFAVIPSIAAPKPDLIPVTGISESPDYFQRHPELRAAAGIAVDVNGDFYQRHPELSMPAAITVDLTDYFAMHPELRATTKSNDLSDYFLRH